MKKFSKRSTKLFVCTIYILLFLVMYFSNTSTSYYLPILCIFKNTYLIGYKIHFMCWLVSRVPLIFTFFRYQWGSLTIDRHGYGKSKTVFGRSVALIETRVEPFEVYLVIYSSKMKIWRIFAFLGTLMIWLRSKNIISR